ncbi:hypothetical protein NUW58_g6543 [Xylaria curta]|uniref:Uncharacterized protein n=1 Tax=Xylaria curta TaxID=42375 RepID=A0ACC1NTV7_9PEZI|nr:hypothetical protein NUW58_g6543 [Xylaria curta]
MSAPRTKRQFAGAASDPAQRQITSFFTAASSSPNLPSTTQRRDSAPSLPASVQANLLSVGMRIRKSVPRRIQDRTPQRFRTIDESDAEFLSAAMGEANDHARTLSPRRGSCCPSVGFTKSAG